MFWSKESSVVLLVMLQVLPLPSLSSFVFPFLYVLKCFSRNDEPACLRSCGHPFSFKMKPPSPPRRGPPRGVGFPISLLFSPDKWPAPPTWRWWRWSCGRARAPGWGFRPAPETLLRSPCGRGAAGEPGSSRSQAARSCNRARASRGAGSGVRKRKTDYENAALEG